jgi:hypothetical protein
MTRMILSLVAVAITLAACSTGHPQPGSAYDAGVTGTVMAGPACPVQQAPAEGQSGNPPEGTCQEKPVQADVRVSDVKSARIVGTIRSTADGQFRIPLAPGQYELQALNPTDGSTAGPPLLVEVRTNAMTETRLRFDTGIR